MRKANTQIFLDFFNERDPCRVLSRFPPKPQFSDDDHELDPDECADSWNEVRLARWIVDSNVGKRLYLGTQCTERLWWRNWTGAARSPGESGTTSYSMTNPQA